LDAKRYHLIGPAKKKKKIFDKKQAREEKNVHAKAHITNIIEKETKAVFTEEKKQRGTHKEHIYTIYSIR